jgi:hypothetical protein
MHQFITVYWAENRRDFEGVGNKHPHRRYPYFGGVVGLAWSYAPESYVVGSVATGRSPMSDRSKVVMTQTRRDTP